MRKSMLLALSLAAFTLIPAVSAKAGKPVGCGSDVNNVVVQFFPSNSDNMPSKIVSDTGGIYTNSNTKGKQIVLGFQISNCTYDFTMDLSSRVMNVSLLSGPTTSNFFNFDRIGSVPVLADESALLSPWCTTIVETGPFTLTADGKPLDNYAPLGCGLDEGGVFARRNVGFNLATGSGLRFQRSPFDANNPLAEYTSYIKVYHPTDNEWTLEPEFPSTSVLILKAKNGSQSSGGTQSMPFKMMITRP